MTKILAVEDNPAILDFYRELFAEAGFEIRTAEDALSAITAQQQFKADLIILDLDIPAGGGMLVFETLRSRLCDPVPIIFSTGKPEQLPDFKNIHNVAIVSKPTDPELLLAEVKRLLPKIPDLAMDANPPQRQPEAAGFRILVVDDDVRILELCREILSKAGFEVQTAEDAVGALVKFHDFKPALLILDVGIPAGGGKKVFERLRAQLASPAPVIFATASPEAVASLAKNLNVIVLKKPLAPEVLIEAVRKLLKMTTLRSPGI